LRGEFSGRNRIWLRDGTLLSERHYLVGHVVSAEKYREVAAKDKALPKFRGKAAKLHVKPLHIHRVFVDSLLEKSNQREARKWLVKKAGDKTARSLGRFKRENDAAQFVEALYQAGAVEVIVPDIYRNKAGDLLLGLLARSTSQERSEAKGHSRSLRHNCGHESSARCSLTRILAKAICISPFPDSEDTARQSRVSSTASSAAR
jgi:hypothetical protein